MSYYIIETTQRGTIPKNEETHCFLNHSTLSSMSFGSFDMAWSSESELEAEGMLARVKAKSSTRCTVIEL